MRTTVCWFSFPLRYYVEAVSVSSYISPSIDEERQCKYVCACLCVSVYVSICLYMYAFTHVFIIHLVFAFCYEAFKGILLGILLPFYTQKIYSMIDLEPTLGIRVASRSLRESSMVGSWEATENTPQSCSTSCSRSLGCLSLTAESRLSGGSFCVTSGLPCVWLSRPPRSEIALGKASGGIALRGLWCLWNVSAEGTWVGPLCCLCVLENRDRSAPGEEGKALLKELSSALFGSEA